MGRLKARANLNGGELDCEHTSQRDKRRATLKGRNLKRRGSEPGPTSMVESWTRSHSSKQRKNPRPTHRVVSWGGKSITTFKTIEGRITKCNAQIPDRPQWRRAGARAFSTKEEERGHKTHSRTNLNGGDLERSPLLVLAFAFDFAFVSTFVLALILAFGRGILTQYRGPGSAKCGRTGNYGRNTFCQGGITLAPCL